ncbi:uncharacterized protein LOC27209175 [Drosophila simulans]|uniref:uncharacterized protein LOC27209175 n=1 Tax=Drosophila simulans TaxID=7240 RepID=UPI00078AE2F5|nr:uncharacterized protein LOC27209175 [Drosophila simulans]KMZ02050.1 uncharacterized protein Dsimw501_GD29332 [Drosophila simulans]
MGRLLFVHLIFSLILLIQFQANAEDNPTKNGLDRNRKGGGHKADAPDVSRFQRSCSTEECREKEFNDMLDSILISETTTEAEPVEAPPRRVPQRPKRPYMVRPSSNGHFLHDVVTWVERTKRAIFGFG